MAASERLSLLLETQVSGKEELDRLVASLNKVSDAVDKTSQKTKDSGLNFAAATGALIGYSAAVKALTVDAALYAARTETLSVVTDRLAKANNLGRDAVQGQVQAVRALGITQQESYGAVNRLIFAQLDLKKATDLARLAQNAAVIAGINSSEALQGIVNGIVTRQPEVLRTYGIQVDFEKAFQREAKNRGRELATVEKQQIAYNLVLAQGSKINGAYEASLFTAGKQLSSLKRYTDEAKGAIGEAFVPALGTAVRYMTEFSKYAQDNSLQVSKLATGITAASVAYAAFKFTPGPPLLKGAVALAAGAGTYAFGQTDPVKYYQDAGTDAVSKIVSDRKRLTEDFTAKQKSGKATTVDAESYRQAFDASKSIQADLTQRIAEQLAKIYSEKGRGVVDEAGHLISKELPKEGVDLGNGTRVSRGDVLLELDKRQHPENYSKEGSLFNQSGYDQALRNEIQQNNEILAKGAAKAYKDFIAEQIAFRTKASDPVEAQRIELEKKRADFVAEHKGGAAGFLPGFDDQITQTIAFATQQRHNKFAIENINDQSQFQSKLVDINADPNQARKTAQDAANIKIAAALKVYEIDKQGVEFIKGVREALQAKAIAYAQEEKRVRDEQRQAEVETIRDEASLRIRLVQLNTRPGGEAESARVEYQIRVQAAADEFHKTQEIGALRKNIREADLQQRITSAEIEKRQEQERESKLVSSIRDQSNQKARIFQLQLQTGDEGRGINVGYDLKIDAANKVFAITKQQGEYEKEVQAAIGEREIAILELRKKERDADREAAGRVFDALQTSGQGGITTLITGQLKTIERSIFQNVTEDTFGAIRKSVRVPGQRDEKTGELTTVGKLLRGTPFGDSSVKDVVPRNTTALQNLTEAVIRQTLLYQGQQAGAPGVPGASALGGGAGDTLALLGSLYGTATSGSSGGGSLGSLGSIFGGATSNPFIFNAVGQGGDAGALSTAARAFSAAGVGASGTASNATAFNALGGGAGQSYTGASGVLAGLTHAGDVQGIATGYSSGRNGVQTLSTAERVGAGVGTAGLGLGVYKGASTIARGGAANVLGGVGAVAGSLSAAIASGLLGASLATGPAAPIVAGIGLGLSLLSSFFGGDKRKERDDQITKTLEGAKYREPVPISIVSDLRGNLVDYNSRGDSRSSDINAFAVDVRQPYLDSKGREVPGQALTPLDPGFQPTMQVTINALDARSIYDRRSDLAEALSGAFNDGHPAIDSIRQNLYRT